MSRRREADPAEAAVNHDEAMLRAVAKYLEANGWKVAVIGGVRVQQPPADYPLNFEFVIRFTGTKPEGLETPAEARP